MSLKVFNSFVSRIILEVYLASMKCNMQIQRRYKRYRSQALDSLFALKSPHKKGRSTLLSWNWTACVRLLHAFQSLMYNIVHFAVRRVIGSRFLVHGYQLLCGPSSKAFSGRFDSFVWNAPPSCPSRSPSSVCTDMNVSCTYYVCDRLMWNIQFFPAG